MVTYLTFPTSKAIIKAFIEYCTPNRKLDEKEFICNVLYEEQRHYKGVLFNKSYYTWLYKGERLSPNTIEFKYSSSKLSIF